jgi:hypothetical protein
LTLLRQAPYSLDYPDLVVVQVRSRNINGWSEYSDLNIEGAIILTEPAQISLPYRGTSTSMAQIHLMWNELVDDELKGAIVTSYYLQWDKATNQVEWYDLVGHD